MLAPRIRRISLRLSPWARRFAANARVAGSWMRRLFAMAQMRCSQLAYAQSTISLQH